MDEQILIQMAASDAGVNTPGNRPISLDQQNTALNTRSFTGGCVAKVADITKLLSGNIPAESTNLALVVFEPNALAAPSDILPDTLSVC